MSGNTFQLRNKVVALVAILALTAGAGSVMASSTINWVTVNGGTATTVTPGSTISVSVNVTLTATWPSWWYSTRYRIGSDSWQCVNTPNHSAPLSSPWFSVDTESFDIIAPMDLGTYDLSVRAYTFNGCDGLYASYTLADAITVVECLDACDCEDDGDPCTDAACEANVCVHNLKDCGDGFCKPDTGECVECLEDANCDEENPFCVDNACVECIED
ncbi:MAG: hypothetical protein GXY44_03595, partial [Phycisphaerales bacterium]|nr:hypothetical protein [Phycisphaerales bacterium]